NDVVFNVLFAAANVLLFFLLLRMLVKRGDAHLRPREITWMLVLFGFGTAHFWCSVLGQVWFTALIVGLSFHLAFIYFAIDARRPFWAGVCLAAAFSTRATLVFAAVFFYWQLFFSPKFGSGGQTRIRAFVLFSLPCLVVGLRLLAYNAVRFESIWTFGHTYLAGGTIPRIRDFGLFHFDFLNRNLTAAFTLTPRLLDTAPYLQFSKHGMSIFLSTPALLWLLRASANHQLVKASIATTAVIAVPLILYQNTGWEQFSYRFILDVLPYLFLILCLGGVRIGRWFKAAIVASVFINLIGASTFHRAPHPKMYGHFLAEEPRR
ncbi:MAG: hypothetical protein VX589_00200, partial [Myxococcota bacterium]|nr:hypothetical protein [Myxococcota bacterium]